jgi:hypothetical protein
MPKAQCHRRQVRHRCRSRSDAHHFARACHEAASATVERAPLHLTRIRLKKWVFQGKCPNFGSNRVWLLRAHRITIANKSEFALAGATTSQMRPRCSRLNVVVHRELIGVGAEAERVVFFLFHVDPVGNDVCVGCRTNADAKGLERPSADLLRTVWGLLAR